MSVPAGWYDDGSGRQRWWDGVRWTDDVPPAPVTSAPAAPATPATPAAPVLGFVGLGLAVVGTILACVPAVFGLGVLMLLAGFVVSLVGVFRKGAAKWPSIVGMILSVLGGIAGTIVFVIAMLSGLPDTVDPIGPSDTSSSSASARPSDTPTEEPSAGRPSPSEIAEGVAVLMQAGGITSYDDMPDFYPCMGQYLYDSELTDETLRLTANGQDVTGPEREALKEVTFDAIFTCDPDGEGAW
ncbi:MAG: DUF2510 domain-containing protein [Microbacterium sp.]